MCQRTRVAVVKAYNDAPAGMKAAIDSEPDAHAHSTRCLLSQGHVDPKRHETKVMFCDFPEPLVKDDTVTLVIDRPTAFM